MQVVVFLVETNLLNFLLIMKRKRNQEMGTRNQRMKSQVYLVLIVAIIHLVAVPVVLEEGLIYSGEVLLRLLMMHLRKQRSKVHSQVSISKKLMMQNKK